ncbi:MAG TPA: hypothetical protein VFN45_00700 [Myxococcaceae bacterium]|jgi:uncharacterized membrane protein|nr:hypothetical protein [Myxococcaceae bacterium]
MSPEPTSFLLCLKAVHGTAVASWMAGQLCIWWLHVHRAMGTHGPALGVLGGLDRRTLGAITTLTAVLSLLTGAGLLAL